MPTVRFARVGLAAHIRIGETVLEAAEYAGAPEGSHCGGVCACSTCHVYVEAGAELLSPPSEKELDLLELSARDMRETSRLGCQAALLGDGEVVVRIADESFEYYFDTHPDERDEILKRWQGRHSPG